MTKLPTPPEVSDDTDISIPLSESLISYIVAMLAPMFLCAGSGDVRLARMAALETLSAYRMQNQADLMTVAQIVAFGIATLSSLSQSMLDDQSLSMVLRLRTNANALSRSGHRHHQMLEQSHRAFERQPAPANKVAQQVENLLEAGAVITTSHDQVPADTSRPERNAEPVATAAPSMRPHDAQSSPAMKRLNPDITGLPPVERRPPTMRAAALSSTASTLLTNAQNLPAAACYCPAVSPPEPLPTSQTPPSIPRSALLPR